MSQTTLSSTSEVNHADKAAHFRGFLVMFASKQQQ